MVITVWKGKKIMLKGAQRKLIMLQTHESDLFETAYFVLREEAEKRPPRLGEMLLEANRILEESAGNGREENGARFSLSAFAIGFALGLIALGALWLVSLT